MSDLTKLFVIDVEATCWLKEGSELQGTQPNEIIEIGVAALDLKTNTVVDRASIVVKPRHSTVSAFCTELTGWTQEGVDKGVDIVDALEQFRQQFNPTSNNIWCSYGEYDRHKLSSKTGRPGLLALYGIEETANPFDEMRAHLNIKTLMALKHRLKRELGMSAALRHYGLKLQGRHHNGADDALNIAQIALKVLS